MPTTITLAAQLGLQVDVQLVPKQEPNVPGDLLSTPDHLWELVTVHETANSNASANAQMHRNFVASGGGPDTVSFNFCVDSNGAIQILPENWADYAQGTSRGNYVSISIETCINSDGNWTATLDNLAKLIAALVVSRGKTSTASVVVQHNVWYGKDCPHTIRHTPGGWAALLAAAEGYIRRLGVSGGSGTEPITLNGHVVKQGFLDLWNSFGARSVEICGLPMSDEYTVVEPALGNKSVTYQDFENVMFQWYDGISPRICAGIRRYKYGQ